MLAFSFGAKALQTLLSFKLKLLFSELEGERLRLQHIISEVRDIFLFR